MSSGRRALIFGISGQDGAYLAQLLLQRGYAVEGTSRHAGGGPRTVNLKALGVASHVRLHALDIEDARSVKDLVHATRPDEIYNLAGQSSVGMSFVEPLSTYRSIVDGTLNILEAIRSAPGGIRFCSANSGESFGDTAGAAASEDTPFRPCSPYGVAKAAAHWTVVTYRQAYGLHASSCILFSHESPLRPARFVTQKIVRGAVEISARQNDQLSLGNLDVVRDWGWAPEYMEAFTAIPARDEPDDFVVATGIPYTLQAFTRDVFASLGLDWTRHVTSDPGLRRPTDIPFSVGNPAKAHRVLGWESRTAGPALARKLVEAELERRGTG